MKGKTFFRRPQEAHRSVHDFDQDGISECLGVKAYLRVQLCKLEGVFVPDYGLLIATCPDQRPRRGPDRLEPQ